MKTYTITPQREEFAERAATWTDEAKKVVGTLVGKCHELAATFLAKANGYDNGAAP